LATLVLPTVLVRSPHLTWHEAPGKWCLMRRLIDVATVGILVSGAGGWDV
jgi:hypothetical protein